MANDAATMPAALAEMASVLRDKAQEVGRKTALKVAGRAAGRVRDQILRQVGVAEWPPLSPPYKARKAALGLDERILRATGEYAASIVPRVDEENRQYVVAPADRPHRDQRLSKSDATLSQSGEWLEYGTVNADGTVRMPARPHWRPVITDMVENMEAHKKEFAAQYWEGIVPLLVERLEALGVEVTLPA